MTESSAARLDAALQELPLVAILRGLDPAQAEDIVQALHDEGFRVAEVPLNSPDAFETIARLVRRFGERMVIGAGTVTDVGSVRRLATTGATLCVAPNTDAAVIAAAVDAGLVPVPGYLTPTEAFAAIAAGARHLKLFPSAGREADLAALRAVLPRGVKLVAVGGARPADLASLLAAGADAAGIGSSLYRPGDDAAKVRRRARAWREACEVSRKPVVVEACWNPQAQIGEGPVVRPESGAISWVDPVRRRLFTWSGTRGEGADIELSDAVCSLVTLPASSAAGVRAGTLVGALEDCVGLVDDLTGAVERRSQARLDAGCRFNDMAVDSLGGLWIGAMHKGLLAGRGALYYASSVHSPPRRVAGGLGVPNGMAFDADERTLFMIDTLSRHLLAFPVDVVRGWIGQPTIATDFLDLPGKPDGMTISPDGALWVAMWGSGRVLRVGRNGAIEQEVRLPVLHASSVCAGAQGELWVTTSRARQTEAQLAETPGAGALWRVTLG
jgi:Entner-Doudoroff aldolase